MCLRIGVEAGGYGGAECKINIVQKINHDGEVNRYKLLVVVHHRFILIIIILEHAICLQTRTL